MSKYKVGDKFVIEIAEIFRNDEDDIIHEAEVYRIQGFNALVFDDNGLDRLQKYDKYAENLERNHEVLKIFEEKYNQGLQDAWELARKIADIPTTKERADIFGFVRCGITVGDILRNMDYQEALAKLEAYEQGIKVGDVIRAKESDGVTEILITKIYPEEATFDGFKIMPNSDFGGVFCDRKLERYEKTGRHIDIQQILDGIGKE